MSSKNFNPNTTCITTVACDLRKLCEVFRFYRENSVEIKSIAELFRMIVHDSAKTLREKGGTKLPTWDDAYLEMEHLLSQRTKKSRALLTALSESQPLSEATRVKANVQSLLAEWEPKEE